MTARELFDLVKDLPKEAWPDDLRHWSVTGAPHFYWQSITGNHHTIPDRCAVLLFEASVARWLEEKLPMGSHYEIERCGGAYNIAILRAAEYEGFDVVFEGEFPTRIASLITAARSLGGGADELTGGQHA